METTYLTQSDFNHFLEERVRERINELVQEIKTFEFIRRDRGLFHWEMARNNSLGQILKTNENILKSLDPSYIPVQ